MTASPSVTIRRARREDVAAILRLLAEDPLGRARENLGQPLPPAYLAAFDIIDADKRNLLAVAADDEDAVLGSLHITFICGLSYQGAERALIEDVRVDSRHRGQGIGHRLLGWAIDEARRRDCRLRCASVATGSALR